MREREREKKGGRRLEERVPVMKKIKMKDKQNSRMNDLITQ